MLRAWCQGGGVTSSWLQFRGEIYCMSYECLKAMSTGGLTVIHWQFPNRWHNTSILWLEFIWHALYRSGSMNAKAIGQDIRSGGDQKLIHVASNKSMSSIKEQHLYQSWLHITSHQVQFVAAHSVNASTPNS